MGGVQCAAHAQDLLDVGATLVAVGTESFREPLVGGADSAWADRRFDLSDPCDWLCGQMSGG